MQQGRAQPYKRVKVVKLNNYPERSFEYPINFALFAECKLFLIMYPDVIIKT